MNIQARAFFDENEGNQDRDYSHPFKRVEFLKELLFKANQETKEGAVGKVNIRKLINPEYYNLISFLSFKNRSFFEKLKTRLYNNVNT